LAAGERGQRGDGRGRAERVAAGGGQRGSARGARGRGPARRGRGASPEPAAAPIGAGARFDRLGAPARGRTWRRRPGRGRPARGARGPRTGRAGSCAWPSWRPWRPGRASPLGVGGGGVGRGASGGGAASRRGLDSGVIRCECGGQNQRRRYMGARGGHLEGRAGGGARRVWPLARGAPLVAAGGRGAPRAAAARPPPRACRRGRDRCRFAASADQPPPAPPPRPPPGRGGNSRRPAPPAGRRRASRVTRCATFQPWLARARALLHPAATLTPP
jgi:hypothetical protein